MNLIKIDWHPEPKTLRKFGLAMAVLCAIAAALTHAHLGVAIGIFIFGAITCSLCLATPKVAMPIYWFWMLLSLAMGTIVSPILFALFYFLLITPMALIMRMVGRDKLRLQRQERETYWCEAPPAPGPERYERQF